MKRLFIITKSCRTCNCDKLDIDVDGLIIYDYFLS